MSKKWYIVHAYSNFEKKVAESIMERAEIENLENAFDEIIVPTEEVVEIRRAFEIFDADGSGIMDPAELKDAFVNLAKVTTLNQIKTIIEQILLG